MFLIKFIILTRNYDENVSALLKDWTCEQEAKYQLELLAKEAETLKQQAEKVYRIFILFFLVC